MKNFRNEQITDKELKNLVRGHYTLANLVKTEKEWDICKRNVAKLAEINGFESGEALEKWAR